VALPEAVDVNPAPDVVEVSLEAHVASLELQPGLLSDAWTYDGGVPGPLIRAHTGDHVIVHFTNNLPEATTIHWHGVRLTADMDGVPDMPRPAIQPGGSFDYAFTVPDASLFWYHPHVHSVLQVGDGLYGALLVEDPDAADFGDEVVLVLSDASVLEDGTLGDPAAGGDFSKLFGSEGGTLLVNGRVKPTLLARRGRRQRWRIVNTARARFYQIAMQGHTFTRIGADGGLITAPVQSDTLLVIPGGRADVVVTPQGKPGDTIAARWTAYDRGYGTAFGRPDEDLFYLKIVDEPAEEDPPLPATLRTIAPLDITGARSRDIQLTSDTTSGSLVLGINGVPSWDAVPMEAKVGDTEVWQVTNTMDFDHPFHTHGFFFQPLDPTTGLPANPPEWRDTFNVPVNGTIGLAIHYDDRPGMWMFHCHILDHADAGMMGMIEVAE
jgi:FtsP/CotA-like multicopper oxidase with cupredoxin domain